MIDYIHLFTSVFIPDNAFFPDLWQRVTSRDGTPFFFHRRHSVSILYNIRTTSLSISGKIITLLHDTQVSNPDDIYGLHFSYFVSEINDYLQSLTTTPFPDILSFQTTRIDYCFNIRTPYVREYLDVMNAGFRALHSTTRLNHTQENHLTGSAYIKTKADYKENTLRNYVLNYYDKYDRLEFLRRQGRRITQADWELARNILRLEVQCGFQFIKELCKKLSITRTFDDMLSYEVAYLAHAMIYGRIFKADASQDFYTYAAAKKLLKNPTAKKVLETSSEHHPITSSKYAYGRKMIQDAGIYPFAFLKKRSEVEVLENPLKLIQGKLVAIGATEE